MLVARSTGTNGPLVQPEKAILPTDLVSEIQGLSGCILRHLLIESKKTFPESRIKKRRVCKQNTKPDASTSVYARLDAVVYTLLKQNCFSVLVQSPNISTSTGTVRHCKLLARELERKVRPFESLSTHAVNCRLKVTVQRLFDEMQTLLQTRGICTDHFQLHSGNAAPCWLPTAKGCGIYMTSVQAPYLAEAASNVLAAMDR
eukprot:2492531-Prymnesium_polylepis.2